ncbi:hypothetical protein B0T16DRAFT_394561 [Cercophora newfieldiana]|uniref:Uncharacterized protein n=1 Tax=Cercophora newfieldiana TaxID=92897 RepID=A0AA39XR48_9PEZI|nr:hypothetical protein B0T16DRAFT_394561 [Cercophora newfieldiana]
MAAAWRPLIHHVNTPSPTPSPAAGNRAQQVILRQGIDIALEYFNSGETEETARLTIKGKAKRWSDRYFKGYNYAAQRETELLKAFPYLFDLRRLAQFRLGQAYIRTATPPPSNHSDIEDMSAEDSPRHSETMSSEEFPKYSEPTLASDAEMDEIVDLRPRNPPQESKGRVKTKPIMRVDAALLRSSGLMNRLPEFLGQLARANLETQTKLADRVEAVAFELDDETAAKQPHISLDIVTGLIESKSSDQGSRPSTSDSDGSSASGIQTPSSKKTKIVIKTSATKKRPTKIKLTVNGSSPGQFSLCKLQLAYITHVAHFAAGPDTFQVGRFDFFELGLFKLITINEQTPPHRHCQSGFLVVRPQLPSIANGTSIADGVLGLGSEAQDRRYRRGT